MSETPSKNPKKGKAKAQEQDEDKRHQEREAGARGDDDQEAEEGQEDSEQDDKNEGESELTFEDFDDLTPWQECLVKGRLAKETYAVIVDRIKNDPRLLKSWADEPDKAAPTTSVLQGRWRTLRKLAKSGTLLGQARRKSKPRDPASNYTVEDFNGIAMEDWERYVVDQSLQNAKQQAIADAINTDPELLRSYLQSQRSKGAQISVWTVGRAWISMKDEAKARKWAAAKHRDLTAGILNSDAYQAVSKFSSRDANEVLPRDSTTTIPLATQEERETQRQLTSQRYLKPAKTLTDEAIINSGARFFDSLPTWQKLLLKQRREKTTKQTAELLNSNADFKASYQATRTKHMKDIDKTPLSEDNIATYLKNIKRKAKEVGIGEDVPPKRAKLSRPGDSAPTDPTPTYPTPTDHAYAFQQMCERAAQVQGDLGHNANAYHLLPTAMLAHLAEQRNLAVASNSPRAALIRSLYLQDAIQGGVLPEGPQVLDPLYIDTSIDVQLLARRNSLWLRSRGLQGEQQGPVRAADTVHNVTRRLSVALGRFTGVPLAQARAKLPDRPQTHISRFDLVQYIDALEGFEWTASERFGSTLWHQLKTDELRVAARDRGADPDVVRSDESTIRAWLIENHKSARSAAELSIDDAEAIVSEIMPDFLRSIHPFFRQVVGPAVPHALAQTHNGHFVASRSVLDRIEHDIEDGIVLNHTSNTGLLCGVRALMEALQNARWRRAQALYRSWDSTDESLRGEEPDIPTPLNYHNLMHAMFADHDEERADDSTHEAVPNTMGRLTDEFRNFLVRRLVDSGFVPGSRAFDEELGQLSTRNNFNATHLQLMVDFMLERRDLEEYVAIGLVVGGTTPESPRAQAHILGPVNDDTPVAWIHHDGVQGGDDAPMLGHYSSITQDGERGAFMIYWGFNLPDQQNLSRRSNAPQAETEEDKAKGRERYQRQIVRCHASACKGCRETKMVTKMVACNGKHNQRACTRCKSLKQTCVFESFEESDWVKIDQLGMMSLKDVPEEAFQRWDAPLPLKNSNAC
ncbi:hypothetical protein M409DRAFT_30846 [Zasmidium cellare ATCC 36951]|uniref:Zn(2)-C6 fungal-type domain-containing protein n=1 Tax=Zasmidium cellare ATCC 36951 TaxID=1080233 RepID=A0A6A6BVV9_ZASCE|nr:uncharacterized protein M409DRAFT_30846 [Zasmidium cellare ATCC 36951]KAF2158683.1 hypothetical protein M409DRAFT_30846 [Zasmidium cellare ATCC 36951]